MDPLIRFAEPRALPWLFVITPFLVAFLFWAGRRRNQLIGMFVKSRLLASLTVGVSKARRRVRNVLIVFAVAAMLAALARPQYGFDWQEVRQRGLDIVVAVDTSKSMLARDIAPNRLERAKLAALDLLDWAVSDRVGLVAFAGSAFIQCPLTIDDEAFRQNVHALDVQIISQGGTALGEAIRTAQKAFDRSQEGYRVILLLTDGEDHEEDAVRAAKKAANRDCRIFTVGVGTPEGELIPILDPSGKATYLKDARGRVVKSRLEEDRLRRIAEAGKGAYIPLRDASSIRLLYQDGLAHLPKTELASRPYRRYHERFQWPLAIGLILLAIEIFIPNQKRVRRPSQAVQSVTVLKSG